jgi:hypothetical protein
MVADVVGPLVARVGPNLFTQHEPGMPIVKVGAESDLARLDIAPLKVLLLELD